eukprot:7311-Heterococcus_DN1.PRE.1
MKNIASSDGTGLSRAKLSKLQIFQLASMNIQQHDHQKAIMAQIRRLHEIPSIATGGDRQDLPSFSRSSSRASNASSAQSGGKPTNRAVAVQAASDERRESLNSTQSNGGQKARRGSNGSSSGHSSIGSGSDPHAQTWTAIQTARSELDKGAKAKK